MVHNALLIIGLCFTMSCGQHLTQRKIGGATELLATIHAPSPKITLDSLFGRIASFEPDVILLEFDSSFFDSSMHLLPRWQKGTFETQAVTRYAEHHAVLLRPFDIEGRNIFFKQHDYFRNEAGLSRSADSLYHANALDDSSAKIYSHLLTLAHSRDSIAALTLAEINTSTSDEILLKKEEASFEGLRTIAERTPQLARFREYAHLADSFWIARNTAMLTHIKQTRQAFAGQRILVLCGFEHGYFLREALAQK